MGQTLYTCLAGRGWMILRNLKLIIREEAANKNIIKPEENNSHILRDIELKNKKATNIIFYEQNYSSILLKFIYICIYSSLFFFRAYSLSLIATK